MLMFVLLGRFFGGIARALLRGNPLTEGKPRMTDFSMQNIQKKKRFEFFIFGPSPFQYGSQPRVALG